MDDLKADVTIIARAVGGDEAAQRILYEAYHAAAFRLAYLFLQDTCDAEEVVQDAFVYVFRNLQRYDSERGSFWAWLRVTLVGRCHNKRRRKQLQVISLEVLDAAGHSLPDPGPDSDPVSLLERLGARRAVWKALQDVSPGARDALILRYYEGLSYTEIADILRCSNEAARARVAHGKTQLRRLLSESKEEVMCERSIVRVAKVG
ncbi:MAG: RNA polymerase sigma factor [Chloroflexota bacterium]|nr:RNA polymerase sigma factor [Chloroflexota bacterium]